MLSLRNLIAGPWRAVLVLGVTQILAWGALFYPPVLTVPLIAAERGWSMTFAMGGFSLALLMAGLISPRVGLLTRRVCFHRELAGDPCPHRDQRLARHLSRLCDAARRCGCAVACFRLAAHARRSCGCR